jgi:hypothetical protein
MFYGYDEPAGPPRSQAPGDPRHDGSNPENGDPDGG